MAFSSITEQLIIVLIFFNQFLEVGCVSCIGKAGAPSLSETHEKNVSKIYVTQAINLSKILRLV